MKKSLGQHFLKSERALAKIIETGKPSPSDVVLEIGPGQGVLTEKLLDSGCRVVAVEKDDELYAFLKSRFQREIDSGHLILFHGDILDFDSTRLEIEINKLIANIPFNITGAILKKFLETDHGPEKIVLLVQKEVAERIIAKGNKESILSISVKVYGTPRYIETVKAGSFSPAPKVDSAIIAIENISKNFFRDVSEEKFFKILRAGFKSKRKKLSSNISSIIGKEKVKETFEKLELDENLRAEDASVDVWKKICELS